MSWAESAPRVPHPSWTSGSLRPVLHQAPIGAPEAESNSWKDRLPGYLLTFHWLKQVTWPSSVLELSSAFHPQWEDLQSH